MTACNMMQESTRFQASEREIILVDDDYPNDIGVSDIFGNVHVGEGLYLNKDVYERLYGYQKKALLWFWGLHRKNKGGILGDDMGLGKTIQVIAFLRSLTETIPSLKLRVLLVLPATLIENWIREFNKWAPKINVFKLHGHQPMNTRWRLLDKVQMTGGVLLTSYGLLRTCWYELSLNKERRTFVWDYMICDEGHQIKNPEALTTKAARAISATHKFILTGTPIQNNLMEFWTLFSFVERSILGEQKTFKREYETSIANSRKKEASEEMKAMGNALSESLRRLTDPYFLHRRKADVLKKKEVIEGNEKGQENEGSLKNERKQEDDALPGCSYWRMDSHPPLNEAKTLTHKNDLVMWLSPSPKQFLYYNQYINLKFFKKVMRQNDKKCVFAELMILKGLCDHPRLLSKKAFCMLGLIPPPSDGWQEAAFEMEFAANDITRVSEDVLIQESGKLEFLFKLLENLREEGHRCLVFSKSLKMLNIIEKILRGRRFRWKRLDGSIHDMTEREAIIQDFQQDDSYNLFLLSTKVGGTGLNLTGADRIVIVDPSWNPSTDNQAVGRAYRIGQTKSVIVYRLITCGTVEEKIYRRQVFKESLIKQTTGNSDEDTYR
ncbi:DNA excision repair protein ERCC-6-like [Lytechinus variegatus]|uniref:DNA excision repair protein ERCC-6-like n=1 Tax=Lytechinus variegatus TaxID=7654 RepID=UPI001BB1B39E|nr:DNA excision repair protein ERCC-6-like [Lytechinus variegatus]